MSSSGLKLQIVLFRSLLGMLSLLTCSLESCSLAETTLPLVIAEALQNHVMHHCKIRRLHLIVADVWSSWQYPGNEADGPHDAFVTATP